MKIMWWKCFLLFLCCFRNSFSLIDENDSHSSKILAETISSASALKSPENSPMIHSFISKEDSMITEDAILFNVHKAPHESSSQMNRIESSLAKNDIPSQGRARNRGDDTMVLFTSINESTETDWKIDLHANTDLSDESSSRSQTVTTESLLQSSSQKILNAENPKSESDSKPTTSLVNSTTSQTTSSDSDVLDDVKVMDSSQSAIYRNSEAKASSSNHAEESKQDDMLKRDDNSSSSLPAKEEPVLIPPAESSNVNPGNSGPSENMPSFKEWTEKRLAEQEKIDSNGQHTIPSQSKTPSISKLRQKNYASSDCGAKIVGTNPESQSSSAILNSFHDEYMLNPCKAKIWLVIELCDAIQTQKIEIANFELFSSSPKKFTVYSSDRYPSRDWITLGSFEATDEKIIQSFSLDHQTFHKYIKLEFSSHYGSEHYCPLSLVHVYGTSELEIVYTDGDDAFASHDPDDGSLQGGSDAQPQNLFGSAKDAVLSIVKKAAEVLTRDKENQGIVSNNTTLKDGNLLMNELNFVNACMTLQRPCFNLNMEFLYPEESSISSTVEQFVSCNFDYLNSLLHSPIIYEILMRSVLCMERSDVSNVSPHEHKLSSRYLQALLGPIRFAALCYLNSLKSTLFTSQPKSYPNWTEANPLIDANFNNKTIAVPTVISLETRLETRISSITSEFISKDLINEMKPVNLSEIRESVTDTSTISTKTQSTTTLQEQIHPTKTLKSDEPVQDKSIANNKTIANVSKNDFHHETTLSKDKTTLPFTAKQRSEMSSSSSLESKSLVLDGSLLSSIDLENQKPSLHLEDPPVLPLTNSVESSRLASTDTVPVVDATACTSEHLLHSENFIPELSESGAALVSPAITPGTSSASSNVGTSTSNKTNAPSAGQKESIFVRLSNRIKALELNMSLSSQYLEELSQRYRKQMEEMQKAFNKTIAALNSTAEKAYEQDVKQQESINVLHTQINDLVQRVTNLQSERDTLNFQILERHALLIFIELFIAVATFLMCRRRGHTTSSPAVIPLNASGEKTTESADPGIVKSDSSSQKRRNSFAGAHLAEIPLQEKRRASDEMLNVTAGPYTDLMIIEPTIPIIIGQPVHKNENKKKKRHKKNSREMKRSVSNQNLVNQVTEANLSEAQGKNQNAGVNSAGLLFSTNHNDKDSKCQDKKVVANVQPTKHSTKNIANPSAIVSSDKIDSRAPNGRRKSRGINGCIPALNVNGMHAGMESSMGLVCNGDASFSREETKQTPFLFQKLFLRLYSLFR